MTSQTLFEKLWTDHLVKSGEDGRDLIYIDRLLVHENSFHAFDKLRRKERSVRNPSQVFGFADHYVPTATREMSSDPEIGNIIRILGENCEEFGIEHFGLDSSDQGILHVVGPELGITQPGLTIAGADSHTSTHGALGAFAFGVGASDAEHVMATQTLWVKRPKTMRVEITGEMQVGVEPKDIILGLIGQIGSAGAVGYAIEYVGSAISDMSVEGRMTICNMSIEAGAKAGMIAVDDQTIEYLRGKRYAGTGETWEKNLQRWRRYTSDPGSAFDKTVQLDASALAPNVTWGTSPDDVIPITGRLPNPSDIADELARARCEKALTYMGLQPGMKLVDIPVDRVFIGSCTNSRIEDLRLAASILKGRTVQTRTSVVPGSQAVKRQAEAEGLDVIFKQAGCEWHSAGCSLCVSINGDQLRAGERSASTSNRNFEGRQGKGARTHLMSPGMAAAAALQGRLADVREFL